MKVAWEQYWRTGQVECFSGGTLYAKEVSALWCEQLDNLPVRSNDMILEVGAGGGFLTRMLLQHVRQHAVDARIVATDYTSEFTKQLADLSGASEIELKAGVDISALPFAANFFDGYTANYAFEYAETELALAELARVLKPGGFFVMNCHIDDCQITKDNLRIKNGVETWLSQHELDSLFVYLTQQTTKTISQHHYFKLAQRYILKLVELDKQSDGAINQSGLIDSLIQLSRLTDVPRLQNYLSLRKDFSCYCNRLSEQLKAAYTPEKLALLNVQASKLSLASFNVRHYESGLFRSVILSGHR